MLCKGHLADHVEFEKKNCNIEFEEIYLIIFDFEFSF